MADTQLKPYRTHSWDAEVQASYRLQAHFRQDQVIKRHSPTIIRIQAITNTFSAFVCQESEIQAYLPLLLLFPVCNIVAIFFLIYLY